MFTLHCTGKFNALDRRIQRAHLLEEWPHPPGELSSQLRAGNHDHWLICPSIGAIQFEVSSREISAFPVMGITYDLFERVLAHEWLPLVYQAWGYQVLHCSAAVQLSTGEVVAFSGMAGAGKSTLGYALGQRANWKQISDETLAMEVGARGLRLVPIPNLLRLRSASAAHFKQETYSHARLEWPDFEIRLGAVFFLQPGQEDRIGVQPLDGAEAYPLFLEQAFVMTLKRPEHNRALLRDYLQIAAQVPAFRLVYPKSFSQLDRILDVVESQID